jgi:CIC family chloride channel protein
LFFGGMCGAAVASIGNQYLALNESDRILLAVGGMSACLGGVVQAPVTAVLIIFEMTHQFALVPGLMLATLVSQLIARRCNSENFYEAILTQDGHEMAHVVPPRDLRSWQSLPISAIAHFKPVVLTTLDLAEVTAVLDKAPYQRFPVARQGKVEGILTRSDFDRARREQQPPSLLPVVTAKPSQTVRECQALLIGSACGLIVVTEPAEGRALAVVTLHDLLRAQAAISEREG